jgi:hypothetical protein
VTRPTKPAERTTHAKEQAAEKMPVLPPGPLHVIISIGKQQPTLFAGGVPVATSAISSGTPGHPTPMGVFTVIQKSRHHVSNLYDAPMPYMQRITRSGSALHEGPLPGHPASHGCVRLTSDFAKLLWKVTKLGVRVIITRDAVAPVDIDSPLLFAPKPAKAPEAQAAVLRTADATPADAVRDSVRPIATAPAAKASGSEQAVKLLSDGGADAASAPGTTGAVKLDGETATPSIASPKPIIVEDRRQAPPAASANPGGGPVSVFVSLKEKRLYVRQGWHPLYEMPIVIQHPERPIGTHVYTAMGLKAHGAGMRWTVVSIPSDSRRTPEPEPVRS